MSTPSAAGRFVSWTGGCLLVGESHAVIPEHAHYALQVAFGSQHGIRFRTRDAWKEYGGAIIPSRQPHSMDSTGAELTAVLLIEPETPQGRAISKHYSGQGIAEIPADVLRDHVPALFASYRAGEVSSVLASACQKLVQALSNDTESALIIDERILRAIAFINANLDTSLTLEAVASEACLSPSRFRHVFVEATGMAFRPYVLWRRFVRVWEVISTGASLSTAAHAAGFADAAHLTRTSRVMFGFPPSALQIAPQQSLAAVQRGASTVATHAKVSPPRTIALPSRIQPLRSIVAGIPRVT